MNWSKEEIKNHEQAAKLLVKIKNKVFKYLDSRQGVSEYEVSEYILRLYKENNLKTDRQQIVAFSKNTAFIHYYPAPRCRRLTPESLIMIDMWARLDKRNSPFADITWMAYYGNRIPSEIVCAFNLVIRARDKAINFIKTSLRNNKLPTGRDVDMAARDVIWTAGYDYAHSTGHTLGFQSPHGRGGRIVGRNGRPLLKNLGYTIEPGIYFKNKFGFRSEIDFYINDKMELVITTARQRQICRL